MDRIGYCDYFFTINLINKWSSKDFVILFEGIFSLLEFNGFREIDVGINSGLIL